MKEYDIVILGGGPGGYVAGIKAAQLGAKVAVIEKNDLGGVCLNSGCIPTKTLLKNAKVYHQILDSDTYGIDLDKDSVKINWPNMLKRKNKVVKKLTGGVKVLLEKNGADTYIGEGKVIDKNTVKVGDKELKTKNLIIATGASPFIPPIKGLEDALEKEFAITSKKALDLKEIPKELVIIGGGVIGIEFATLFASLNTKVTVLEKAPNILLNVDKDVRKIILKKLKKENINIITGAEVKEITSDGVKALYEDKTKEYKADKVLVSIGMKPNTKGLEHLELETEKGRIITNEKLETNVKGIYAIGDVNGRYMLAHVASAEGIVAVENIMGKNSELDYNKVPAGIYTHPEIAFVGLTEEEAREKGYDVTVGTFSLTANGRALAEAESEGLVKVVADKKYGELLGVHIISPNATDMISEAVVTMALEGTIYDIANAIHPHPTFSEIILEASDAAIDKPIHALK